MITDLIIGQRLRSARLQSGKTQQSVADILGVKRCVIVQIELGNRSVKLVDAVDFCILFGLTVSELAAPPAPWETPPRSTHSIQTNLRGKKTKG